MPNPYDIYPKSLKELPAFRVPNLALHVGQWYVCCIAVIGGWVYGARQYTLDKDDAHFDSNRFFCAEDIEHRVVPVEHLKQTL